MNLELEIRELELVLDGFPAADKDRIARAVQRELERLFVERGVPPSMEGGGDVAKLDDGSFEVAAYSSPEEIDPEEIGTQVARMLYGGLRER
jgi:hypothetical protein